MSILSKTLDENLRCVSEISQVIYIVSRFLGTPWNQGVEVDATKCAQAASSESKKTRLRRGFRGTWTTHRLSHRKKTTRGWMWIPLKYILVVYIMTGNSPGILWDPQINDGIMMKIIPQNYRGVVCFIPRRYAFIP